MLFSFLVKIRLSFLFSEEGQMKGLKRLDFLLNVSFF